MRVIGVEPDEVEEGLPTDYWQACRLAEQGQYDDARRLYVELEGTAKEADVRLRALVRNDLAALAALEGRFDEARQGWQQAMEVDPDCQLAHLNDALIAAELDRLTLPRRDVTTKLELAPAPMSFAPDQDASEGQGSEELKISALVDADNPPPTFGNGVACALSTPPDPPFARGGKGGAGLVGVEQQNLVWTGAHDTPVNASFSSAQTRPPTLGTDPESRNPVKVAILSFLFNWPSTGGYMHTAGLAQFLARAGYEVRHIFARFPGWGIGRVTDELLSPAQVIEFDAPAWNVGEIQARYRRAVDEFDPDYVAITDTWNMKPLLAEAVRGYPYFLLIQAQENLCPLNNLRLLAQGPDQVEQCPRNQLATPEVCHRCLAERGHHSGALHQVERALSGVGTPEYDQKLRRSLQEAEAVLALNPLTAAMLEPFSSRVWIVPWGIDPARFPWPPPEEARSDKSESSPMAVVFMAAVVGEFIKGFHVAHEACRLLRQTRSDFELVVTFDPPGPGRIDEFTRSVGWCSQEELPRHYRAADISLVPTIAQDGLSITSVEAMASGIPVVASRIGGVPYTVSDGVTGLLFEPGDAADLARQIARLLDDPALRRRMGLAGRRRFENDFTWQTVIERHWQPLLKTRIF